MIIWSDTEEQMVRLCVRELQALESSSGLCSLCCRLGVQQTQALESVKQKQGAQRVREKSKCH